MMVYGQQWNTGNKGIFNIKKRTDKIYKYLKNHYGKWSVFMMKIKIT